MSSIEVSSDAVVEALTQNVVFEGGNGPENLTFVSSIGFMATTEGGRDVGGLEVVGFLGRRGNLYPRRGGYPTIGHRQQHMVPMGEISAALCFPDQPISIGNHPYAQQVPGFDSDNTTIELWAATVHPRVRVLHDIGHGDVRVRNEELGRPRYSRSDLRRPFSLLGELTLGTGWAPEYPLGEEGLEAVRGRVVFNRGSIDLTYIPWRKIGTVQA